MEKTIKIAEAPGIPQGFCIVSEKVDGTTVHYLRRTIDDRRIRIEWVPGTKRYTAAELSRHLYKDGDDSNDLLKDLL